MHVSCNLFDKYFESMISVRDTSDSVEKLISSSSRPPVVYPNHMCVVQNRGQGCQDEGIVQGMEKMHFLHMRSDESKRSEREMSLL